MCKRLHDCSMLDSIEVQALLSELGWSAYGLLQAVLDECFKQSTGTISSTLKVLSRVLRCEEDELCLMLSSSKKLGLLEVESDSRDGLWTIVHLPTLQDKESYSQRKQGFKERASRAAKAKLKKCLTSASSTHQAHALAVLGEEEEVEEKEEEKILKEGGLEGESEVGVPAKQQVRSRKPNYHPETADELPLPASLDNFEVRQALTCWLDHRAKLGKKYKSPYWLSTLAENWDGKPDGLIDALKYSAGEGYMGIFPRPHSNQNPKQTVMGVSKRENETLALIEEMRKRDQESLIVEVR